MSMIKDSLSVISGCATRHTGIRMRLTRRYRYAYHGFEEAYTQRLGIPPRSSARTRSSPRRRMHQLSTRRRRILSSFQGLLPLSTYVRVRHRRVILEHVLGVYSRPRLSSIPRRHPLYVAIYVYSRRHRAWRSNAREVRDLSAPRVRTSSASD